MIAHLYHSFLQTYYEFNLSVLYSIHDKLLIPELLRINKSAQINSGGVLTLEQALGKISYFMNRSGVSVVSSNNEPSSYDKEYDYLREFHRAFLGNVDHGEFGELDWNTLNSRPPSHLTLLHVTKPFGVGASGQNSNAYTFGTNEHGASELVLNPESHGRDVRRSVKNNISTNLGMGVRDHMKILSRLFLDAVRRSGVSSFLERQMGTDSQQPLGSQIDSAWRSESSFYRQGPIDRLIHVNRFSLIANSILSRILDSIFARNTGAYGTMVSETLERHNEYIISLIQSSGHQNLSDYYTPASILRHFGLSGLNTMGYNLPALVSSAFSNVFTDIVLSMFKLDSNVRTAFRQGSNATQQVREVKVSDEISDHLTNVFREYDRTFDRDMVPGALGTGSSPSPFSGYPIEVESVNEIAQDIKSATELKRLPASNVDKNRFRAYPSSRELIVPGAETPMIYTRAPLDVTRPMVLSSSYAIQLEGQMEGQMTWMDGRFEDEPMIPNRFGSRVFSFRPGNQAPKLENPDLWNFGNRFAVKGNSNTDYENPINQLVHMIVTKEIGSSSTEDEDQFSGSWNYFLAVGVVTGLQRIMNKIQGEVDRMGGDIAGRILDARLITVLDAREGMPFPVGPRVHIESIVHHSERQSTPVIRRRFYLGVPIAAMGVTYEIGGVLHHELIVSEVLLSPRPSPESPVGYVITPGGTRVGTGQVDPSHFAWMLTRRVEGENDVPVLSSFPMFPIDRTEIQSSDAISDAIVSIISGGTMDPKLYDLVNLATLVNYYRKWVSENLLGSVTSGVSEQIIPEFHSFMSQEMILQSFRRMSDAVSQGTMDWA
ncbi:MAG: hypothetical protein ACK40Q_04650, partial [Pseudothermotoga sp.]